MDEERRTSVNLAECIRAARHRVGVHQHRVSRSHGRRNSHLDGGSGRSAQGRAQEAVWLDAYERQNVDIGLSCGLRGRAQIGKGMWAMPDLMADMLRTKISQPQAGANTAWVPSPTAATLHALHYHKVNVAQVQTQLAAAHAHRSTTF